jgi:ABC-2 type transport system permease protein/lipopolysaccharide transport system permease protein
MLAKALKDLRAGFQLSHVWTYQAYHEISAKYKRTVLGSLWIAGSMVFTSLAFAIVFGAIFHQSLQDNLPYIMGGLMSYGLVACVLTEGPDIYLSNTGIISNHAYPFTYYNFEWAFKNLLLFAHNLVVFEISLVILQRLVVPHWSIVIGLPIVVINIFTWGGLISLISSRYRDLRFLMPYLSQLIMFITPVTYKASIMTGIRRYIVDFNPVYPFIEMVRSPLLGTAMPLHYWPMAISVTLLGVVLWLIFFSMFRKRIAFWV